ncbi:MAG: amylo-alpha-1,6-glucosidase [Chloroflexota bacterium]
MQHRRIIKRGPIVLATHEDGTMDPTSASSQGLFQGDTRFLSRFKTRLNGLEPILLGSSEEILFQTSFIFTNPELEGVPARGMGLLQHNSISEEAVEIDIRVANWSLRSAEFDLSIEVDSDFFDSFEARGVKRLKRGQIEPVQASNDHIELAYVGLDNVTRRTKIAVSPPMGRFQEGNMHFHFAMDNGDQQPIKLRITMVEEAPEGISLEPRAEVTYDTKPPWFDDCTRIGTDSAPVDAIILRSVDDLRVLMTEFDDGWVPSAGLPRFTVPFGRDSLITGIETLMWNPALSKGVLQFLADRQGKEENAWNYEQPGKIMHEMHTGELARLKEVPFGLFYGSVDSTVLFLILGAEYIRWTGDLDLWHALKTNFLAAWQWIEKYGDIDGTGYVQYQAHTPPKVSSAALTVGLFNQGWKDSSTSVMYGNGQMVTDHPISLAEVQGDLYRALDLWAGVYGAMPEAESMQEEGERLRKRANTLKEQFNREFWMPEKQYFAMALDGHHRQVDSITSNPLECLWARLIDDDKAEALVKCGMSSAMLTTWGIRTMANTEKAYNPFSYHDGSVWPFENALIAAGLKKYGFVMETQKIFDALVDASMFFEYRRWPEVYAGVSRDIGGVLAVQPDASRPQAWSSGAIFLFLQTILGIATQPFSRRVDITPVLPSRLNEILVENMAVNGSRLSLRLVRDGNAVLIEIRHNPDNLEVMVHPAARYGEEIVGENAPAVSR